MPKPAPGAVAHAVSLGLDPSLCAYCRTSHAAVVDHIIGRAMGDRGWNLLPACLSCNSSKGDRPVWTWLPERLRRMELPEEWAVEILEHLTDALQQAMG